MFDDTIIYIQPYREAENQRKEGIISDDDRVILTKPFGNGWDDSTFVAVNRANFRALNGISLDNGSCSQYGCCDF